MRQKYVIIVLAFASVEVQRAVATYRRDNTATLRTVSANALLPLLPAYREKHVIVLQITTMVSANAVLQVLVGETQLDNIVTLQTVCVDVVQQ